MKNSNLRAVNGNQHDELRAEGEIDNAIKPLNSHFHSFGEALFSWTNSEGFEKSFDKCADAGMVKAFCTALNVPFVPVTNQLLNTTHYFESDAWVFKYIEDKGFVRRGRGVFLLLDESNRPIALLDISRNTTTNVAFEFYGAEHLALEFRELMKKHVKVDAKSEKKTIFAEVVIGMSLGGMGGGLQLIRGTIDNPRVAQPEFYPYLDGGIEALLRDFIESDESVLILKGNPGTGKSSLVAAGIEALSLLPIYAKRADAIADKGFINFVFQSSDEYMAKIAGTAAKARSDLFKEQLVKEREFLFAQPLAEVEEEAEEPRVPIIVVEDADLLLTPRSQGNQKMAELLNETDGIGSNHTRKIIFTTNLANNRDIDEALMRPGRCYAVIDCRLLTPSEAVLARAAGGLPNFEEPPTKDVSLAEALRKPRKKIFISNGKAGLGFN
jgi:hypothetical protein